ncbi:patatin-like phospholipase family protein [Streptomyces sp. AK02-01A]|uniref:patatin-like phospholipase family protein n=1 Tax=Streptomyces sp. AK02-01A TaxID=3028648 RepID=UPI0029BF7380|nr:patatin-like phospholipase family protein [Streptomyces sp. AK02-01A]MDX3854949.1 patatin-like phospholipase family protein [Streptomyces sp. AK02-01A]
MTTKTARRPLGRVLGTTAALATVALVVTACSSPASTPSGTSGTASKPERPRVGIILGGGGESGVAWETAVLAALDDKARLTRDTVDVVVGTSAGAIAGAYFSAVDDLGQVVEAQRAGKGVSAPVPAGKGDPLPKDVIAALSSTQGTIEERGRRIGALAMKAKTLISGPDLVAYVGSALPDKEWPALDFRATSVNAGTGETVLWKKSDDVPLAAAVASSAAVPGFLPAIEIDGQHYTDAPRATFSAGLVKEKKLDAIIYIGMPTPNLSNTVEEEALSTLEDEGLKVVRITGGEGTDKLIRDALNPKIKPLAVTLGTRDGADAAKNVAALLHN